MSKNANLHAAKAAKNDEFYTRFADIQNEILVQGQYNDSFRGKTVLCPCDDIHSNFFQFFGAKFEDLGLKKLICTHYDRNGGCYAYIYEGETDGQMRISLDDAAHDMWIKSGGEEHMPFGWTRVKLEGDGDFRNPEMAKYFDEADIVVTNPPFSLFRDFITTIRKHNCDFLVLSNTNAVTYKEIFPLIKNGEMWSGFNFNKSMEFIMPDSYELKGKAYIDENGKKHGFVPAISWFTNLPHAGRKTKMNLSRRYHGFEEEYPKYDNYDAIEVSKTKNIPSDYDGVMGVPISALDKLHPDQFEIVGATESEGRGFSNGLWDESSGIAQALINGKRVYKRLFIRRK